MKKFGTPIGAGAGRARARRSGCRASACRRASRAGWPCVALLLGRALDALRVEPLAVDASPALDCWLRVGSACLARAGAALARRFGAPPACRCRSGGGVAVGVRRRAPGRSGRRGRSGRPGSRRPVGVGVAIGPLSMICAIARRPGTRSASAGVPGGTSTVTVMRWPVTSDDGDGVQLAPRPGARATPRPDRGRDSAMITSVCSSRVRVPPRVANAALTSASTLRVRRCSTRPRDVSARY